MSTTLTKLQQLVRVNTVSHSGPLSGGYRAAVDLLRSFLEPAVSCREVTLAKDKPILIATVPGTDPSLPSVLLNGHYDVVPAEEEKWTAPPFGGEVRGGWVYGRGTQDMKSVLVQYVEALLRLANSDKKLRRTVHATFVPDEEIGGADGMGRFVESDEYAALNVGVALDEGLANEDPAGRKHTVFYAERAVWWLMIRAEGPAAHASRLVEGAAMDRLVACVNRFLAFRESQRRRLHGHGCEHAVAAKLGDVVTVNLTALRGGVTGDGGKTYALNVVPTEAEAGFDIRVPPGVPLDEMEARVKEWTDEFGLTYRFQFYTPEHGVSPTEGPFFEALRAGLEASGVEMELEVFPAGTDGRYMRCAKPGVPVYGFSPMSNTPVLLHDHDERVEVSTLERGVAVYEEVIARLASVVP